MGMPDHMIIGAFFWHHQLRELCAFRTAVVTCDIHCIVGLSGNSKSSLEQRLTISYAWSRKEEIFETGGAFYQNPHPILVRDCAEQAHHKISEESYC